MNKTVVLILICMLMPLASHERLMNEIEQERIRVEPSQLAFVSGGIFANLGGEWVPVDAKFTQMRATYLLPSKRTQISIVGDVHIVDLITTHGMRRAKIF